MTGAKVADPSTRGSEDRFDLTIKGKNLPRSQFVDLEYPYLIRFIDPKVRTVSGASVLTGTVMRIRVGVQQDARPGPKAGYIMGRYFPRLFVKHAPKTKGFIELLDGTGQPDPPRIDPPLLPPPCRLRR